MTPPCSAKLACLLLASLLAAAFLAARPAFAQGDAGWADEGPAASDANSGGAASPGQPGAAPPPAREARESERTLLSSQAGTGSLKDPPAALKAILARPEFQVDSAPPPQPSWLEKLLQRLMAWLSRVFTPLAGASVAVQVIAALGVLLVLGLLLFYITKLIWQLVSMRRGRLAKGEAAAEEMSQPAELLAAARQALEAGDFRQALRLRFRALLASLDIAAAPLMTNRELAERITEDCPATGGPLAELIGIFEDAWYGGVRCEVQHYQRSDELARAIEERVRLARAEAPA